jgi:hypothetical protein
VIVRGHQPFIITEVSSPELDIVFEPTPEPKPLHALPLTLSPKSGSGEVKGKIFVKTNLPGDQVVEVGTVFQMPDTP